MIAFLSRAISNSFRNLINCVGLLLPILKTLNGAVLVDGLNNKFLSSDIFGGVILNEKYSLQCRQHM